ncbi:hypothetical protein BGZ58_009830 [Dissophora ornata]|nr:hypothetical protein BGZ58_009830 [Dissophora ornata]
MNHRQTTENERRFSRPNSFASGYQLGHSRRGSLWSQRTDDSQRGLTTSGTQGDNDSFDRICSMLSHLIVDASTAVGTTDTDGPRVTVALPAAPAFAPLIYLESESPEESPSGFQTQDVVDEKCFLDPSSDRDARKRDSRGSRSRARSLLDKGSSKRRSLFLELQDFLPDLVNEHDDEQIQDVTEEKSTIASAVADEGIADEGIADKGPQEIPSPNVTASSSAQPTDELSEDVCVYESSLHPPKFKGLRRCASFPSMKSEMANAHNAGELQHAIQYMDSELDRTVETINGLAKDLMAVAEATRQSWIELNLERSLQSQDLRNECLSPSTTVLHEDEFQGQFDDSEGYMSYWEEEEESLENSAFEHSPCRRVYNGGFSMNDNRSKLQYSSLQEKILSTDDFSKYFKALEKIAGLGQELAARNSGNVHGGDDDLLSDFDSSLDTDVDTSLHYPGSSYTLTDATSRMSSSSDRSLGISFDIRSEPKDDPIPSCFHIPGPGVHPPATNIHNHEEAKTTTIPETAFTANREGHRCRRVAMPAAWPVSLLTAQDSDQSLALPLLSSEEHLDTNHEGTVFVARLTNTSVCLGLLFFWTMTFAFATLAVIPSLAERSVEKAMKYMGEVQKLLALRPPHDDSTSLGPSQRYNEYTLLEHELSRMRAYLDQHSSHPEAANFGLVKAKALMSPEFSAASWSSPRTSADSSTTLADLACHHANM